MIVYQTNYEGVYVGPVEADPSPLEPGVWLIPGGAVEQEPPALAEGERARWSNGAWEVLPLPEPEPEFPEPQPPTLADYQSAIEAHVDDTARGRGYISAVSCASYVASTIPAWAAEAAAFIAWRDSVWAHVFAQLALVEAGDRKEPTVTALVAELPEIKWPA